MRTFTITMEIVLKDNQTDFIRRAVEEQLEDNEYISESTIKEIKEIDYKSLELDGIDRSDFPDFCDAFICCGYYKDGTKLDDDTLDELNKDSCFINELVHNRIY
jgi:hypothetical protein